MECSLLKAGLQNLPSHGQPYAPYGFSSESYHSPIVGFVGQCRDAVSGLIRLGNGRRMYSPSVCRFTSPDSLSPFGGGGVNAYAYCAGDPVNYVDPSGQSRYGASAQARIDRHILDGRALGAAKLPKSLRPQLEHFRLAARKMNGGNVPGDAVVARLYKKQNPHNAYNRWDLKYSFETSSFTADFVYGNAIVSLPAGKYAVSRDVFILGVGGYQPARGLKNYKTYEVGKESLEVFYLPAAQHEKPSLANSAWPEVWKEMWDIRCLREIDKFDSVLERYSPPAAPSPPPRRP